jgi:hypothetical protein
MIFGTGKFTVPVMQLLLANVISQYQQRGYSFLRWVIQPGLTYVRNNGWVSLNDADAAWLMAYVELDAVLMWSGL